METILMNTENNKVNEPYQFALNLSERLDLRSSNEHVGIQNIYLLHVEKHEKRVCKK